VSINPNIHPRLTHTGELKRQEGTGILMSISKTKELIVSATGTWRVIPEPGSPKFEKTALPVALGIRSSATLDSVLRAVHKAARANTSSVLSMPNDGGQPAELLKVRPAREQGYAIVSVKPINNTPKLADLKLLQQLFDLTTTEAEVAQDLMDTEELRDIATRRSVSVETVRMHVKNLLRKTGMSSQKKLTALLTTLALLATPSERSGI